MRKSLDLPFVNHHVEGNETNKPCVIVWSTFQGGDTVDHICVVDVPENDPAAVRSKGIAEFVTKALNHYVSTKEGKRDWDKTRPLLPSQFDTKENMQLSIIDLDKNVVIASMPTNLTSEEVIDLHDFLSANKIIPEHLELATTSPVEDEM